MSLFGEGVGLSMMTNVNHSSPPGGFPETYATRNDRTDTDLAPAPHAPSR